MSSIPNNFIFMKVGNHAGEDWEAILARKRRELVDAGLCFWGYGGAGCHPINQVQPFARLILKEQGQIGLVMVSINSHAGREEVVAREFSSDGIHWEQIPDGVRVTGSKYALVLDKIEEADLRVDLTEFEIGAGPSRGKSAEKYIVGRADKACLTRKQGRVTEVETKIHEVRFTAELKDPFAVLLR